MAASTSSHKKHKYRKLRKNTAQLSVGGADLPVLDTVVCPCQAEQASSSPGFGGKLRFVPEKLLGTGGLCEVVSATDLLRLEYGDGSPRVAVKRLLPKYACNPVARGLLAREFFIARNISHSGVVRYFDLHECESGPCISMEFLSGGSLYDVAGRHTTGMGQPALPLARQLLHTLAVLHSLGIAHGDIKPANLMLERNNRLVLFDFNTAEIIPQTGRASSPVNQSLRSALHLTAYSPLHASPERLQGHPPSFADDIFAACCTLYELVEGCHPFCRKTALESMDSGRCPTPMNAWKGRLEHALCRGLSFDPCLRPCAAELEEALKDENPLYCFINWLRAEKEC